MTIPDLSSFKYNAEDKPAVKPSSSVRKRKAEQTDDLGPAISKRPKNWPGPLPPILEPGLKIVFVGFNPGIESGKQGHHYAHHSNRFWKFLFWSGITSTLYKPADDVRMPKLYRIGFTDLVARCTKGIQQLSKEEMAKGADLLDERIAEVKPRAVCLVGKGIWEAIASVHQWDKKKFSYGLDVHHRFGKGHSALYCVPSTSGLNSISVEKQLEGWKQMVHDVL